MNTNSHSRGAGTLSCCFYLGGSRGLQKSSSNFVKYYRMGKPLNFLRCLIPKPAQPCLWGIKLSLRWEDSIQLSRRRFKHTHWREYLKGTSQPPQEVSSAVVLNEVMYNIGDTHHLLIVCSLLGSPYPEKWKFLNVQIQLLKMVGAGKHLLWRRKLCFRIWMNKSTFVLREEEEPKKLRVVRIDVGLIFKEQIVILYPAGHSIRNLQFSERDS